MHCGPDGIYVSALGNADGDGPGGVFIIDHETFEVLGRWEVERGPQQLAYDLWWHLGYDTVVTSEWGTPNTVENGLVPEILLGSGMGAACTSGTCTSASTSRRSISGRSINWCSSFARRTIPLRPTASSMP